MIKKVSISLSALMSNVGQIAGLPPNPRLIKDEKFEALKKSLTDDPEMLDLRETFGIALQDSSRIHAGGEDALIHYQG